MLRIETCWHTNTRGPIFMDREICTHTHIYVYIHSHAYTHTSLPRDPNEDKVAN